LAREKTRKALRLGGLAALAIIVILGSAFFAFRNALLRSMLHSRMRAYEMGHPGAVAVVAAARFSGLTGVELQGVRLRSGSIAVDLGRCAVKVSLWRLLAGQVRLRSLALADLRIALGRDREPAPTLQTEKSEKTPLEKVPAETQAPRPARAPDFGARVARLLDVYFTRIPDSLVIDRFFIHTAFGGVRQALYIPSLAIRGPAFATNLDVFDQGRKWSCALNGEIRRGEKSFRLRLRPIQRGLAGALPFLERQWDLKAGFESLSITLRSRGRRAGVLFLDGSLAIAGLALNHPRIAVDNVDLEKAGLDFSLHVGADSIELVHPSRVAFNRMAFEPRVRLVVRPTRQVMLKIPEIRFAADDLFASLPAGLFTRLAGIRTTGAMAFHLDFAIDLDRPEAVVLDVGLDKNGFRILRYGNAHLQHFAGPFLYTAYEKDHAVRSFVVGPENPSFRFLERIPSFLQHSVMISEDGAFFSHRGFLLEPFKNSIVTNLRAGRFVRGASTISMQLVKNLFLRRHKTIARKLEELLITWLIEENRLVSKGRMLETYLNVIEWGPGVYGAQEAARFYFAKDVEELTLAEAIFMAAIVPRPKRFMGFFGDDQRLRPWVQGYYADVARKMLARGWISQFDFDTLLPEVTLTGPAKSLLKGAATAAEAEEEIWVDGMPPAPGGAEELE